MANSSIFRLVTLAANLHRVMAEVYARSPSPTPPASARVGLAVKEPGLGSANLARSAPLNSGTMEVRVYLS